MLLGEEQTFHVFVCFAIVAYRVCVVIVLKAKEFPKILPITSLRIPCSYMAICKHLPSKTKPFWIMLQREWYAAVVLLWVISTSVIYVNPGLSR